MSPDAVIARLAAAQHGNVTYAQLKAAGVTPGETATRRRNGLLIPRHRGVFAYGYPPGSWISRAFAAWLTYGPASGLSHRACAAVFEVLDEPDGPIHVSRPTGGRSQRGTVLHEADVAGDLWHRRGLTLTSPTRLLLDLAATEPPAIAERAWNQAQVLRLVTPAQLNDRIEGWSGRRGISILRSFIDDVGVTRSILEDLFRALLRQAGVLGPEMNVWIDGVLVDAVWRSERVIVELDGRAFHAHDVAFEADRRKTNALQLQGWLVLRFTYRRLRDEPAAVIGEITAALSR